MWSASASLAGVSIAFILVPWARTRESRENGNEASTKARSARPNLGRVINPTVNEYVRMLKSGQNKKRTNMTDRPFREGEKYPKWEILLQATLRKATGDRRVATRREW
jgi:hypothetical protein